MPKKDNKIEVGSLWQEKDASEKDAIYIVTKIVSHPWSEGSVYIDPVKYIDNGLKINVSIKYLRQAYRKVG